MTWNEAVPSAEQQRELKRDALLRQAAKAFRADGYHGSSLADIAANLGISKPTLYYYVKNKQDLLYQCHLAAADQALDSICTAPGLNALERLTQTMQNYVASMISEGSLTVVILEEKSLNDEQLAEVIALRDQFQSGVIEIVAQGQLDGSIRKCEPKFGAFCVLGTANWVTKWYRPEGRWREEDINLAVADFIRSAMAPETTAMGRTALFGAANT